MTSLGPPSDHAFAIIISSCTKNSINSAMTDGAEPHFVDCTSTGSFRLQCGRHGCPLLKHWKNSRVPSQPHKHSGVFTSTEAEAYPTTADICRSRRCLPHVTLFHSVHSFLPTLPSRNAGFRKKNADLQVLVVTNVLCMLSQLPMPISSQRRASIQHREEDMCNRDAHCCSMSVKQSSRELWPQLSSKATFHVPRDRTLSFLPVSLDWLSSLRTWPSLPQAQSCTALSVFDPQESNSLLGARLVHASRHRWPYQPYSIPARAQRHNWDSASHGWMGGAMDLPP